jgi:glycosyltransferase involved in cell wall biosynthesis
MHNTKPLTEPRRQPLRLAIVTETYPPEINGVARTVGLMVAAMCARGHRVQLIRPRQHATDKPLDDGELAHVLVAGVPIPRYQELKLGLPAKRRLLQLWQQQRPDLVHIVTEGPLGGSALRAAKTLGLPVSSDFHTNFHSYSRHYGFGVFGKLVAGYLRSLHNKADCTMVPTQQMRDELAALGFDKLLVVGRGIDTALFNPARRSRELRAAWGCRGDETVALYVGRLAPEKNLDQFVEAVRVMRAVDPALRVVLVGDGPEGPRLRRANPDFVFAGMRVDEDLAAHYASADAFIFPSMTETFGNVTLEAMASGLAVAAYDYAAAARFIANGESGLLARFDDRESFNMACSRLARDAGLRATMRAGARRTAESLSWDGVFDELETVLLGVIAGHRAAQALPDTVAAAG